MLERLLAASPDAVLLVDQGGRIAAAHGATMAIFGYSPAELVGRSVEDLVPVHQRAAHHGQRDRFAGDGHQRPMGSGLTVAGLREDGTTVPLDVKLTPLELDGQRYVAAVARDVTHLAEAQEALAARTAQLEALDREKNRILGVAAHDLRNPLAALRGFVDLLEAGIFGNVDARAPGLTARISRSIDYMVRLVDGLVDFSAIESGHLTLKPQVTDVAGLVGWVADLERVGAASRGIRVLVDCQPGTFRLDPAKFEQVLYNLVGNAVRYSHDDGEVRVGLRYEGGQLVLRVEDDGPGIDPDLQATLFHPFTRGGDSGRPDKGVGLGLAIVQRIVEGHGGTIELDSRPGDGARFTVRLPGPAAQG